VVDDVKANRITPAYFKQDEARKIENALHQQTVDSLKRQIEILMNNVEQGKLQNRGLVAEMQRQAADLADARMKRVNDGQLAREVDGLKHTLDRVGQEKKQVQEELDKHKAEEEKLKKSIDQLTQNVDQLTKSNNDLQQKLAQ
jgi:chromosome segregation ATPase